MSIQSEHEYEDLLGQWSDLESGLGVILSNSANAQEFTQRVTQYDHWMQGLHAAQVHANRQRTQQPGARGTDHEHCHDHPARQTGHAG